MGVNRSSSIRSTPCDNRDESRPAIRLEPPMADLPSGTVTFLFTDIEGSTALWERDRAAMRVAVERHLAILRSTIEAHHGVLYKTNRGRHAGRVSYGRRWPACGSRCAACAAGRSHGPTHLVHCASGWPCTSAKLSAGRRLPRRSAQPSRPAPRRSPRRTGAPQRRRCRPRA